VDRASGRVLTQRTGAKLTWAAFSPDSGRVVLSPLPGDLAGRPCLSEDEVRYICAQAARIEEAAAGVPQDVEWAIARDLPFPDSVFFLQHRPETTWTAGGWAVREQPAGQDAGPTPPGSTDPPRSTDPPPPGAAEPAFDPVKYALRHVFKVPGT